MSGVRSHHVSPSIGFNEFLTKVSTTMAIRPDISLGSIISTLCSLIAIVSVIVTIAFYGATMRSDVDRHEKDIADLRSNQASQAATNAENLKLMTEMNTHLTYMRQSIERIEKRTP